MTIEAAASPGIRFTRLGSSMKPMHLLDAWFLADAVSLNKCNADPGHYMQFWQHTDQVLGRSARFVFIGELDPREDLSSQHRLAEIIEDMGVDVTRPVVSNATLGVSLHEVKRWPGYYILLQGSSAQRENEPPMATYVFRYCAMPAA